MLFFDSGHWKHRFLFFQGQTNKSILAEINRLDTKEKHQTINDKNRLQFF